MPLLARHDRPSTLPTPTELWHRLFDTDWTDACLKIEELQDDGAYVVRAELPDIDPAKDVTVTVEGGTLHVHAERRQDTQATKGSVRSEFRYGIFDRIVQLPEDIDPDKVEASYAGGVLTVRFPLPPGKVAEEPRVIPVTTS